MRLKEDSDLASSVKNSTTLVRSRKYDTIQHHFSKANWIFMNDLYKGRTAQI